MQRQRFRRKPNQIVAAVALDLDTEGLVFEKWGAKQRCKRGDFIVDNNGDVYTVSADTFRATYRKVATGQYIKVTPVWAVRAEQAGSVATQEGATHYQANDYIVSNDEDGRDAYAIARERFESMYELDPES